MQTTLIVVFAALFFFAPGARLFAPLTLAGDVLAAAGLIVIAAAIVSLREVVQIAPEPREGGRLVTGGAYRWLRHPIYTGIALAVIGLILRLPGMYVGITGAALIAFLILKSRFEETLLSARYPEYADYRKRTLW